MAQLIDDQARAVSTEAPVTPVRILAVDDVAQNLLALEAMLDDPGITLVRATSGEEALRWVLKADFAAILLDVLMPGMDGLETAELIRARERSRATPIIFVTAAGGDEELVRRGYATGAVDFIVKPIQPAILRSKVAVFADLFRKTAQVREQADQLARLNLDLEARVQERTRELQAARTAAERDRARLQQILEALPEGIMIADATPGIVAMNRVAEELCGVSMGGQPLPIEALGAQGSLAARHLDGAPYAPEQLPLARALLQGETIRGEQFLLRNQATGHDLVVLASSAPLRAADGSIGGAVTVFQDFTATKELERQRDEFLATLSHDLKNPLASIVGMSQLLQRRLERHDEPARLRLVEGLEAISQSAWRMVTQIDELLDLIRLRMGQTLELERASTDVAALLVRLLDEYQRTTDRHALRLQMAGDTMINLVDARRLNRALANLLGNAIKYSPEGGEVLATLTREEVDGAAWMVIGIVDRGIGIPSEDLPHIFERYFRASNVAGRIGGSGLGLTGVRQIVEQHGGTIVIASEQGMGTSVTIRLPIAGAPAAEERSA